MDIDYSKDALVQFIQYASEKGLISTAVARDWNVAVGRILSGLSEAEVADIRTVDLDATVRMFVNRNPTALAPASLRKYQQRVALAVEAFVEWAHDPTSYKPRGLGKSVSPATRTSAVKQGKGSNQVPPSITVAMDEVVAGEPEVSGNRLPFAYPLRANFLARLVVPTDITTDEVRRLTAFLQTIAVDYKPVE